jgi:hypothetical protein
MATNPRSLSETVLRFYRQAHERLLKAAEVRPDQFAWSAGPSLHSIAWHMWHAARWDDYAKDDADGDSNVDNAFIYLEHLNRHLGMIEAIRGLQGVACSVTR